MRKNASEIIYDEVSLLGIPALLTDWRVERSTIPTDFHLYELRHADEDWGDPCQLFLPPLTALRPPQQPYRRSIQSVEIPPPHCLAGMPCCRSICV